MSDKKKIFVHMGGKKWITVEMDSASLEKLLEDRKRILGEGGEYGIALSSGKGEDNVPIKYRDIYVDREDIGIEWPRERRI